ncbi:MAG: ATP-binding protein [Candidatus Solibacter sp.]
MHFRTISLGWRTAASIAVCGLVGLLAFRYFPPAAPPGRQGPLRIGFEANPPVQIRSANGYSGLSVDTVSEAARRAGIELKWVETGKSSEESLREGLVDLWPLVVDIPERRANIHFARPWMHSNYVLMLREGIQISDQDFTGRIAVFKIPLHARLSHERFPAAQIVETAAAHGVISQVCTGAAAAGFFEMRMAHSELRERPPECGSSVLRLRTLRDLRLQAGVASTFEAAGAADRIQQEIGNMFRDGSQAILIAKYSYFGLDDTWASYEQLDADGRKNWSIWLAIGVAFAAGVVLWLATSLRQREHAAAALRESEGRFRSLADTAPVMIVASAADGRATFFNKTWLDFTGRTMEAELGNGWTSNLHPDDRHRALAAYSSSLAARETCSIEYRLRRADGEYRHIMCTGVPRFESDGAFGGYIASGVDLTDLKIAHEEARESQNLESLGVLAGGIAHDFNNFLGGTLSYSELAQMKLAEGTSPDEELLKIRNVAIRGREVVRQLMIFAGKEGGTPEFLDVPTLVSEMLVLLQISISKHATIETSLSEDLPPVRGNAAQIRQVVMNLVTNASEAIGDQDGVIRVSTELVQVGPGCTRPEAKGLAHGSYLLLEVSDNGTGMTQETLRKAFDPFFSTKFTGRGMGLAMVQRIVRGLGGTIHVASAAGEGTSMRVMLPGASTPMTAKQPPAVVSAPAVETAAERTILIVEDEEALLSAVSKLLQRRGFSVLQASNGSAALELIRTFKGQIDAMLLDFTLPGASSRTVLEAARMLRPDLLAILTSAYSRESVTGSLTGLTIEHFIRKPFHIEDLVRVLQARPLGTSAAHGA